MSKKPDLKSVLAMVDEAAARQDGWDGEGSKAADPEQIRNLRDFLSSWNFDLDLRLEAKLLPCGMLTLDVYNVENTLLLGVIDVAADQASQYGISVETNGDHTGDVDLRSQEQVAGMIALLERAAEPSEFTPSIL